MSKIKEGPGSTKCYIRHTIMSGEVRSYARDWSGDCKFPRSPICKGPFEISASRDAVIVHAAELKTSDDFDDFNNCLGKAELDMKLLKACDGRPDAA